MSWVIAQPPTGQPLPPTGPLQPSNDSLLSTTPARGSLALRNAFVAGEERGRAAFISYFLAGYPAPEDTVDILLAMERGGTDVIEYTLSLTPIHSLRHRLVRSRQYAFLGVAGFLRF